MYADAFLGVVVFALIAGLFYGPWQTVCTDVARQQIFESRDAIFDLAREGRLDVRSDAYKTIRECLNVLIRFAHQLTIFTYLAYSAHLRGNNASELTQAIDRIADKETRARVVALVGQAHTAVVVMVAKKSSLLLIALLVVKIVSPFRQYLRRRAKAIAERVQIEAESVGALR